MLLFNGRDAFRPSPANHPKAAQNNCSLVLIRAEEQLQGSPLPGVLKGVHPLHQTGFARFLSGQKHIWLPVYIQL